MNAKTAELMLRCNSDEGLIRAVVGQVVERHNKKPAVASNEFLLEVVRLRPDLLQEEGPVKPE